jgi:hypothetical protein
MTPPKKPDWMEIADNDGGSNNLAPSIGNIPVPAIAIPPNMKGGEDNDGNDH